MQLKTTLKANEMYVDIVDWINTWFIMIKYLIVEA